MQSYFLILRVALELNYSISKNVDTGRHGHAYTSNRNYHSQGNGNAKCNLWKSGIMVGVGRYYITVKFTQDTRFTGILHLNTMPYYFPKLQNEHECKKCPSFAFGYLKRITQFLLSWSITLMSTKWGWYYLNSSRKGGWPLDDLNTWKIHALLSCVLE